MKTTFKSKIFKNKTYLGTSWGSSYPTTSPLSSSSYLLLPPPLPSPPFSCVNQLGIAHVIAWVQSSSIHAILCHFKKQLVDFVLDSKECFENIHNCSKEDVT